AAERDDELAARDEVARGGARPEVDDVVPDLAGPRLDLEDLRLALAGRVDEDADGGAAAVGPDAERFHQRGASQAARAEGARVACGGATRGAGALGTAFRRRSVSAPNAVVTGMTLVIAHIGGIPVEETV